jgi:hypothetical protein
VYNIEMDVREDGVVGTDLAQDKVAVEGSCEYGNEPSGSIKCLESLE